jgi:hypothetical protein
MILRVEQSPAGGQSKRREAIFSSNEEIATLGYTLLPMIYKETINEQCLPTFGNAN